MSKSKTINMSFNNNTGRQLTIIAEHTQDLNNGDTNVWHDVPIEGKAIIIGSVKYSISWNLNYLDVKVDHEEVPNVDLNISWTLNPQE